MNHKTSGAVFTPDNIAKFMTTFVPNKPDLQILEPACGEGVFFKFLDNKNDIIGIEINKEFIDKCSIYDVKLIHTDFIDYRTDNNFDIVIGNPPYIRIQNIPEHSRTF